MKKGLRLLLAFLLMMALIILPACFKGRLQARDSDEEITGSENVRDGNGSKDGNSSGEGDDDSNGEDKDSHASSASPQSSPENRPTTSTPPPGADVSSKIVKVDREDTVGPATTVSDLDQYGLNKRLLGLIDESNPHGIVDYMNGIVSMRRAYVLNERFAEDIIAGIKLGSSFSQIKKAIGEPGMETDDSLLYRNWNYYLLFKGPQKARHAVLMKDPGTCSDKHMLGSVITALNGPDYTSLDETLEKIDPTGVFFEESGFINGGGYYASSGQGINIIDFDERYIEVYNNYQGELYDHAGKDSRFKVRFINQDMTVNIMLDDYNRYSQVEELFGSKGVASPDGKLSAVFEWVYGMDQHFIVRTLDNSIQDRYIYAATNKEFYWLTNSHLIYIDAFNEAPYAIDVNFSDPSPINILYEAGIIKERDVEAGQYQFEIVGIKNSILSLKETNRNEIYTILFTEGKNGALTFQAEELPGK